MKFTAAVVGAGALCTRTDAFVPVAMSFGGSSFISKSVVLGSSASPVAAARGGDVMMSLGGGGSKKGGLPKGVSSRITNLFRGSNNKGNSNDGSGRGGGGGGRVPPLGASSSAEGEGDKKAKGPGMLWQAYERQLDAKPIITKTLTSVTGFAVGDILAQKFLDKKDQLDLVRLLKFLSFGCIHGFTGHFFYNMLDTKIPGKSFFTIVKKVSIDQLLWNPVFGCLFFGYMGAVDGLGPNAIGQRIKNNLWLSVKGSWTVWPVAHAINFRAIPTNQRLLYINTVQVFYNCYLSIIAQRK